MHETPRWFVTCLHAIAVSLGSLLVSTEAARPLHAQGVTTAAVSGIVGNAHGGAVDGAIVRVLNRSTGFVVETAVRGGRFVVRGLEVGGPYQVVVRRPGFAPSTIDSLFLSLGERLEITVILASLAASLDTIQVDARRIQSPARERFAGGSLISDSTLRRLPTKNRDVYDFVQLVPQVSTRLGLSGAGVNSRFNSYLLDGVSERALQGNAVAGLGTGGKPISLEAIKEYQVLLSPFSVRYGDFAGVLINAVTRGGTNDVHGSGFAYLRNERLARNTPFLRDAPYERLQFGASLGGPVVRDRAHFFLATELQRFSSPASGPYLGQPRGSGSEPAVRPEDATRFSEILRAYGLEAGSAGRVGGHHPLTNVFGRVDVDVPAWDSRLVVRHNFNRVRADRFARSAATPAFPLSSLGFTQEVTKHAASVQLVSRLRAGAVNELTGAYMATELRGIPYARGPLILVTVPHASGTGTATLQAGTHELAQDVEVHEDMAQLANDITIPVGTRHSLEAGARVERFAYHVRGVNGSFGRWTFANLGALERGEADSYRLTRDFGTGHVPVRGLQISTYIGDEWRASDRLTFTVGVRADVMRLDDTPDYTRAVDSTFGRRTSDVGLRRVHWSPRLSFLWNPSADLRSDLRGGTGIFVGRPPLAWIGQAFRLNGRGIRTLACGTRPTDSGPPPVFIADYRAAPNECASGGGFGAGSVTLVDRDLGMAKTFRAMLAYNRHFPWAVKGAVEALYTRNLTDFIFVNLNLAGPQDVDRHGRVMYGTVDARGRAIPAPVSGQFPDVIELRNHSRNYSYHLTTQLQRRFSGGVEATAGYTFSRVRDVQSPTSIFPNDSWAGGRALSGRHDDMAVSTSSFELPHRVVLAASVQLPWKRWATNVSLYYTGESGSAFTYVDSAGTGMGDLNADGSNANDPIYVPTNSFDSTEIRFTAFSSAPNADNSSGAQAERVAMQQAAFERFIAGSACLRRQRGRMVARNSCRGPWVHTMHASVRQSMPVVPGHALSLQLEVFNLLNLLNTKWGLYRVPNPVALQQVGQIVESEGPGQPVFWFEPTRQRYSTYNLESGYQLQIAMRYSF